MGEKSKEVELSLPMNTIDQIQNSRLHSADCPNNSEIRQHSIIVMYCTGSHDNFAYI